jgi:hypothetical protein
MPPVEFFIDHGQERRQFSLPCNIAGRTEDLRDMAEQILQQLEHGEATSYVQIVQKQPALGRLPATPWAKAAKR